MDATKRERGTSATSDASSGEGSYTSEESSSKENTTPPTVVPVVPDTVKR